MAWVGYNTDSAGIKTLLQQESDWTAVSKPVSISDVEELNNQIYSEIRVSLKEEDISLTITDEDELKLLVLINNLGTAALIEKIKYDKIPQGSENNTTVPMPDDSFQKRYENKLKNFIAMKKAEKLREETSYSAFGVHSTVKCRRNKPFFKKGMEW